MICVSVIIKSNTAHTHKNGVKPASGVDLSRIVGPSVEAFLVDSTTSAFHLCVHSIRGNDRLDARGHPQSEVKILPSKEVSYIKGTATAGPSSARRRPPSG